MIHDDAPSIKYCFSHIHLAQPETCQAVAQKEERESFFCRATEKEGEKKTEGIGEGRKKKKNMNSGICAGCRKKIAFGKS